MLLIPGEGGGSPKYLYGFVPTIGVVMEDRRGILILGIVKKQGANLETWVAHIHSS